MAELADLPLTELIIETGIHDAIARKLNEKGKLSHNAIAEGIINNVRKTIIPGLIDAHVHIESSRLLPDEFARLVLPHGTTTVVADPHEIANVLGTDGVHWLLDSTEGLPLDVFFMAPSCVPASRFESPRRALNTGDLEGLLRRRRPPGLLRRLLTGDTPTGKLHLGHYVGSVENRLA